GIYGEAGTTGIIVDNCSIESAVTAKIRFDGTINSVVKNSVISLGAGHGIILGTGALANTIDSNIISNNGVSPAVADGIQVTATATANLINNNDVTGNTGTGINNLGGITDQFYYNNACNNGLIDCFGLPLVLVGAPGTVPVTLGQNICCTHNP